MYDILANAVGDDVFTRTIINHCLMHASDVTFSTVNMIYLNYKRNGPNQKKLTSFVSRERQIFLRIGGDRNQYIPYWTIRD